MFECCFYWLPPNFQNIEYPSNYITVAWSTVILTLLILLVPALYITFVIANLTIVDLVN